MFDQSFNSAGYFDALFNNTLDNNILLMDEKGVMLEINKAFSNSFGYVREDIMGKELSMLFTEADQLTGKPQNEISKVLSHGQASDNNFLVHKDKSIIWVSGESILIKNPDGSRNILKVIHDINEQKISENSIVRLNDFNESILGAIEDVVIVISADLKIIKANKAFFKLSNIPESDIRSLNFSEFIKPFDALNELYNNIQKVLSTKKSFSNSLLEIETSQGAKKIYDVSGCLIEHTGANNNILLVAHDITMQKQAEKEREDIIGFVAHELRNPLANIVLCNEMMTQLILDNEMADLGDYLTRSKNNVMRLNKMIGELYDATKFNSGNFSLEESVFDFDEMIEEALDTMEVLHPEYSINVEGECTTPVYGDRYRLIQVVTNFLSNGIKYSNNNTKVIIEVSQKDDYVTVSVKDEGLGISEKQLPHIFGRFFRAEKTKNLEGIGLGLYLCHRIIAAHNGKIWAESEEGKGSTFYFTIPV